jgi:hypothetical protein
MTCFQPERLGEYGIGPVLPFEPVRSLGHAHQMRRDLRIEVGRHLDTRCAGDRGRTKPSADPSDPHQIRHDIIAGPGPDGLEERPRTIEVLAELDGGLELARELRVAREIIVSNRLFEPVETLIVEGVSAVQRVAEAHALVEVGHQLDVIANGAAYRLDGGDIVSETFPPETQLQTLEIAFGN